MPIEFVPKQIRSGIIIFCAFQQTLNKDSLEQIKPNLLLVNTARGPLVNADDLYRALQSNRIAGAVLDVLDIEPPKEPHPLIFHPKCLVTPHIAWAGLEARKKLLEGIMSNIYAYKKGLWSNPVYFV
jgi:glycerate dehydrogenase